MLGIVIFFTVFSSIVLPIFSTSRDRQLDAVVRLLENQLNNDITSSDDSTSEYDVQNIVGQNLKIVDVINLIKQANKNKETAQRDKERQRFRSVPNNMKKYIKNFPSESYRNDKENSRIKNLILEQLKKDEKKPLKPKRLTPNRLLSPTQYMYENEDRVQNNGGLSQYSKIFVILDPIALQNSKNTEDVQSLLSEILEKSSSAVEKSRHDKKEPNHYKGFVIKDNAKSRRYRRDSNENDDDYRPKKSKMEHGGGGGGGGGRTAIPYIRHRGDIYEKEH